ncbi:spore coat protein GerQ [Desertibacillus haloalkaliphilus]|nr:spore coat protein GerQ [Desertibacillus haloalkaliphilus]
MNHIPGYYPASGIQGEAAQQQGGFPMGMPSGPAYSTPVVPIGAGQQFQGGVMEESFIENILRFNKGKVGTFYFTYQGNNKWNAMVYQGRVETAGRDHIIISDPASGKRYLLMMANLDWVEFAERINYPHTEISQAVQESMEVSD